MCWIYKKECLEEPPEGEYGFIYLITNLTNNKLYVGKKTFLHKTKKRISKRVIKQTKTRKRVQRGTKDSGWLKYWGSSLELKEDILRLGEENFKKEILIFCKNKSSLSYYEGKYMYQYKVLEKDSYNKWIKLTVYKHML